MNPTILSESVIKACYAVHNELGIGFLEKVYENALAITLGEQGIRFEQQARIDVLFHEQIVGEYRADFLVENQLVLELKACSSIENEHQAQLINYLKATRKSNGLLINFAKPALEIKRAYFERQQ